MSKLRISPNNELEIAEFIAAIGGVNNPSDEDLWEIAEAIDTEMLREMVFSES